MATSIFVSHVYEDLRARDTIVTWATLGLLGPNVVVTGESEDVRQHGDSAIKKHLHPKLQGAAAMILLLGNDTHNHSWIEYELRHALSARKRVLMVRIPGTTGGAPASASALELLPMDAGRIRVALGI